MASTDAAELVQDGFCRATTVVEGSALGQIEQHRAEHYIAPVQSNTADQIGLVFAGRKPTGSFTGGTASRQDEDRAATDPEVTERICVQGDEQIGLSLAGALVTVLERHKIVAGSNEDASHARHVVDLAFQLTCDRQGNGLLVDAAGTDCTRVLTAVTGIDRDDHLALAIVSGPDDLANTFIRSLRVLGRQVDDQAMTIL